MKYILFSLLISFPLAAITISPEDAHVIGMKMFANECSSKKENLVFWHPLEPFPSLGIAHCIWYPAGYDGPYTQTFPALAQFLKTNNIDLPAWVLDNHCPWKTREEFLADTERKQFLTNILSTSLEIQTHYLIARLEKTLPTLLEKTALGKRTHVQRMFELLSASAQGIFALIDYANFKGEGTNPRETYEGKGWGLRQVLENMPATTNEKTALSDFSTSAIQCLEQRAALAPREAPDKQRLLGWTNRIKRYQTV